jgi:3-oxoacyl-[acyl-carrier-protein] synthase III
MRIETVQHVVPSRQITNEVVLEMIRERNRHQLDADALASLEQRVSKHLASAGTQLRYSADGTEKPIDCALNAGRKALAAANVSPADVDFLIYAGVGRGWLEPATANVIQHRLELTNATCFDLLDACASWLRALQVAHTYIRGGVYRRVLIVNCECGFRSFADLDFADRVDLEHRWAAFTIGEAATATLVSADHPDDDFYFTFKNFGEYFDLCMIPLENADDFLPSPLDRRYPPMKFFGRSRRLIATTVRKITEVYEADANLHGRRYDLCFGHAASERASAAIGCRLGLPRETYFQTHPGYGNTVSASIPLGMSLALAEGRLRRGHETLVVVGSAGIVVAIAAFTF